jgi:hypothetical protein
MSLKAFHIAFIFLSAALSAGFAAWCFRETASTGNLGIALTGVLSAACAVGLGAYGIRFVRKTKGLGYL